MSQNQIEPSVLAGVKIVTNKLENWELSAFYMAVTAGWDLSKVAGYDKIKPLLTEAGGTKVHADTLKALDIIVAERLGGADTNVTG